MKYKKYTIPAAVFLILAPLFLWPFRAYFMETFIGDIYIHCFRHEKPFDDHHILTELAESKKKIIVNSEDGCVCRSIRMTGYWEKKNSRILEHFIKPGQTILEVGANYGYYTLNFAYWLKGKGKIISYEANPAVFKYLEQSVKLNHDENMIQLMPLAASNKKFEAYLTYDALNVGGGYVITPESPEFENCKTFLKCLPIKSSIIDEDLKDINQIDVLKIDIEGSEIPALMGAEQLIDRSPDLIIVMEWSPSSLKKFGDINEFLVFLTSKKFKFWIINQENGGIDPVDPHDLPNHPFLELILSRKNLSL